MESKRTFEELNNELLGGLGRRGLLSRQIGGDAAGANRDGVVAVGIFFDRSEIGVEVDVVMGWWLVVEAVFVVERRSDGLGLGLFHRREIMRSGAALVAVIVGRIVRIGMRHTAENDQQLLITGRREPKNTTKWNSQNRRSFKRDGEGEGEILHSSYYFP